MKLQFKHQAFQREAASAVVEVFAGQPLQSAFAYRHDVGAGVLALDDLGYRNPDLALSDEALRRNIRAIQLAQGLEPIETLHRDATGTLALSIEMETGTGKTYTYIKTMYELNKRYGWTKFVIVVPSVAIREGVVKSLKTMADHFALEYGRRLQHFVYDSSRLTAIDQFASDTDLHVMVINTQAFNARGEVARRIRMRLEDFGWRRPIDVLGATRPILIIDEPQSVLGKDKKNKTRQGLADFKPLFSLLYSATHRPEDLYNQIYRLDAIDAYEKQLVKKIEVRGVEKIGTTATGGYVYLEKIVLSRKQGVAPQARIHYDVAGARGLRTTSRLVSEGFDLYAESGELEAYRDGFQLERIDGVRGSIRLSSGVEIFEGKAIGDASEEGVRRAQIRTTIELHLERERYLYSRGIKVLSLFFIDAVEKYRVYEAGGETRKGRWAEIFEEEYRDAVARSASLFHDEAYERYLAGIDPESTHNGYFSQDKQGKLVDSKVVRGETTSQDPAPYQLIMRDKERLLSLAEPTRFIFSHSALREGWDNPNVFQICTLKQSDSQVSRRQEIGRGLRLCVDQRGVRQDSDLLGAGVHETNILTVVASESYASFAEGLQREIAESITSRPRLITEKLFVGKTFVREDGTEWTISAGDATSILHTLIKADYVDDELKLTEKYHEAKEAGTLDLGRWQEESTAIISVLDQVYDPKKLPTIEDAERKKTAKFRADRFERTAFKQLWEKINRKTYYEVNFETESLIQGAIRALDERLTVTHIHVAITSGALEHIPSREALEEGTAMRAGKTRQVRIQEVAARGVSYDLLGKLVQITGLKRSTIAAILSGVGEGTFAKYRQNPEEFIIRAGNLINEQKAIAVIERITYHKTEQTYKKEIFSEQVLRGELGIDAVESSKSLYDLVVVDSLGTEKRFAEALEEHEAVEVYTKLPRDFYISTPVGRYNPDWAIAFHEGAVKHIYFVAETKGSDSILELREVESTKIACARKHFASISDSTVTFDVVPDYATLYNKVMH